MSYQIPQIAEVAALLTQRAQALHNKHDILRAVELKALFEELKTLPPEQRGAFGKELNALKQHLEAFAREGQQLASTKTPIDITAPYDINTTPADRPHLLPREQGTIHPLTAELSIILDIFYRMGFTAVTSREIDDDYHMFGSLNFPEGHPARDEYDTFMTTQTDSAGKQFVAPAHTSIMQTRILRAGAAQLAEGKPIAALIPGRVFRNEDLDARHEHTFHQLEGVYVAKGVHAGNLLATFKTFLSEYYQQDIEVRSQPFYFPFTEPSFELALSCPFCQKAGCNICSHTGWIELLGMGMIHPNVLAEAGIDANVFTGFAWGCGLERLVMMKHGIEDIRHFHAGKLDFLRQFS